jgi:outer membrane lipoprotein-sorting protein
MHAVDDVNETREVVRMAGDGEPPRVLDFLEGGRGGLHVTQDSPRFAGVSRRETGLHANSLQEQNTDAHLGCHSQEAHLAGLSKAKFSKAAVMLSLVCATGAGQAQLKTAQAVLEKYQQALGGVDAIRGVQSETRHGKIEGTGIKGEATFVSYAKPFKSLFKVTRPDGQENLSGFDGAVSWSLTPQGAKIDKDTPIDAVRRDADLQYALHQPDYFQKLELAGVTDFDGRSCYWLHGVTHWGKDNNQFYDVRTGLLAGYRFQADSSSSALTTLLFQDYKSFGRTLVPTRMTARTGDRVRTFTVTSVTYEPLADSIFDLPPAVKALLK